MDCILLDFSKAFDRVMHSRLLMKLQHYGVRGHLHDLLEPWDIRELYIRKTADLPMQLCLGTFPRFVATRFYFLSETLIEIASPIIFLFIHNHLTFRKWCYTPLLHDFTLDPLILSFHFHFRTFVM